MESNFIVSETASSGNDEFYTPYYALVPIVKYLNNKGYKNILYPFDTEDSRIVIGLKLAGFNVVFSHLENKDFFSYDKEDLLNIDIILSNPPYSIKQKVFAKLFSLGKPFAMLVGVVGLFESKVRFNLFKENDFEIMYFDKRVAYHSEFNTEIITKSPPFSSAWVSSKLLDSQIEFEEINKKILNPQQFLENI